MQQGSAGQVSPDGRFYWNGAEWVSAISADGRWRWTPTGWEANAASAGVLPSTVHPFESPANRALLVTASLGVVIFAYLLLTAGDALALAGSTSSKPKQFGLADLFQAVGALLFLLALGATIVLFCRWIHRAYRNLPTLGPTAPRFTAGWAVGWWFVPLFNIFRPFQVMRDLWQGSSTTTHPLGLRYAWWGLWLISNGVDNLLLRPSLSGGSNPVLDLFASCSTSPPPFSRSSL